MRPITLLVVVAAVIAFGTLAYLNRRIPTPEELEFDKKFDREAVLVKTCGTDPGVASGIPLKVYRFENELWFDDRRRWRRVDGKLENVCDLLDIDQGHRAPTEPTPASTAGTLSRVLDLFRKEPAPVTTPPKEIPPPN
jgi:hypothetical protein